VSVDPAGTTVVDTIRRPVLMFAIVKPPGAGPRTVNVGCASASPSFDRVMRPDEPASPKSSQPTGSVPSVNRSKFRPPLSSGRVVYTCLCCPYRNGSGATHSADQGNTPAPHH